ATSRPVRPTKTTVPTPTTLDQSMCDTGPSRPTEVGIASHSRYSGGWVAAFPTTPLVEGGRPAEPRPPAARGRPGGVEERVASQQHVAAHDEDVRGAHGQSQNCGRDQAAPKSSGRHTRHGSDPGGPAPLGRLYRATAPDGGRLVSRTRGRRLRRELCC